jgi:hypothetical protein
MHSKDRRSDPRQFLPPILRDRQGLTLLKQLALAFIVPLQRESFARIFTQVWWYFYFAPSTNSPVVMLGRRKEWLLGDSVVVAQPRLSHLFLY